MLANDKMAYDIARKLGISKQVVAYEIKKMLKDDWIIDLNPAINKYKFYRLTDFGKKILDGFEKNKRKTQFKIENARHTCYIQDTTNLQDFLKKPEYDFKINTNWKNSDAYYGRIEGWSVAIFVGKKVKMVVTPPPIFSDDMMKAHHKAVESVLDFCNTIGKKWNFTLTCPEPTTHRQYTVSDPFAESMMKLTGGSQIKFETKKGTVDINQSHQQEERIEFDTPEQAQRYLDVPDLIESLMNNLDKHHIENMKSLKLMAEGIFQNSKQISELVNLFKNNSSSTKSETNVNYLNSEDFTRMYQ